MLWRICAVLLGLSASCAQPPDAELRVAGERLEAARSVDAATFATDALHEAERALASAYELSRDESYLDAIHAAGDAVARADDAYESAIQEQQSAERRLGRCLLELEGLIDIARSRGAPEDELTVYQQRVGAIATVAERDLLRALDDALRLKPELLAFERRFHN